MLNEICYVRCFHSYPTPNYSTTPWRRYYKCIPKMQMYEISSANLFKKLVVLATLIEFTFVTQKNWVRLCNELLSPCEHFYVLFQMLQTQRNKTKIHTWFFVWIWNVFEKLLYQTFISNDTLVSTSFMTSQDSTLFLLFCWVTSLKILLSNSIGLCTDMSLQLIAYHNLAFSSPSISTLVLLSLNFQRWIISSLFCHSSGPLCLSPPFLAFF